GYCHLFFKNIKNQINSIRYELAFVRGGCISWHGAALRLGAKQARDPTYWVTHRVIPKMGRDSAHITPDSGVESRHASRNRNAPRDSATNLGLKTQKPRSNRGFH
ncbi:hypothetical protein, partial [Litorivita sp. NS0012-18]|uniref:hypothetical protein n=1 Tax=Litorivita sp. NS0012-18 TaxID=3127655 RepID=UPI00334014D1